MCRRPCSMTKKPYSSRSDAVGTVNRSMAAISSLWLRKKAIHRFSWSGSAGRRGRYRDTVISEMMKPSLVSSAWDAWRPPAVLRHRADEATNLGINPRPTGMAALRDICPVPSESVAMPTGYGVRVDDEQAARPHGPRTSKSNPESPFRVFERWAWALFLQRRHLLP